jgi:outer membrane protein OmpA-like peptidoglycan-associated protein
MKYLSLLLFLLIIVISLSAKVVFEPVPVPGIENPTALAISPNGLTMIIVDQVKKGQLILKQSVRPHLASSWSFADPVTSLNHPADENFRVEGPCFSYNGNILFLAANYPGTFGGLDIWYVEMENKGWSKPKNMGSAINTAFDESYPSLSGNQRNLYFTRNITIKKLEDFNCGELWFSSLDPTSTFWQKPEKLNTAINAGGIAHPKISDDNKTILYSFISNDKTKWDIFWAKRFFDKHWYLPLAIDTLISKESEISPLYLKADGFFYFISNEGSDKKFKSSIYRLKVDEQFIPDKTIIMKGKVTDIQNKVPVSARIKASNPFSGEIANFQLSNPNTGSWEMLLNEAEVYMLHASQNLYSQQYELFTQDNTRNNIDFNFNLFPTTELIINIYDQEILKPLNATIEVTDQTGKIIPISVKPIENGRQLLVLPIGCDYSIKAALDFYHPNELEVGLSTAVLFDRFVRDIELKPILRDIEFRISDIENQNPIEADISIFKEKDKKVIIPEKVAQQIGRYTCTLYDGMVYEVDIRGPKGYIFRHIQVDLKNNRDLKQIDVALEKFKVKVPVRLNNINFEFNSADLIESSFEELNRLIKLMTDNPEVRIEIMAHTDDIGSDLYNDKLSDKRAFSVIQYLFENGIDNNRLVSKGYGKRVPLVPNDSDENRALNRRVEMKILDFELFETIEVEKQSPKK